MSLREACNTSAHGEGVERLRQPDLQITFKTLSPYSSYYAQQAPSAEPTGYWPTSPHWNWRIWPVRPQGGYVTLTSRFTLHSLTFYSTEICLPSNKNFDSKTKRKTNAYDKNFEQLLINNGYLAHWSSGVIPKAPDIGSNWKRSWSGTRWNEQSRTMKTSLRNLTQSSAKRRSSLTFSHWY